MLSMLICSLNNTTLHHSRNAYGTWKKKSKFSLFNAFYSSKIKSKRFYTVLHTSNKLYLKQHEVLHCLSVASLEYVYKVFRHHCLCCLQFKHFIPKCGTRTSSTYTKWRKTYSLIISYLPSTLAKKLRLSVNKRNSKYGFSFLPSTHEYSNQHVLDFPHYFKKDSLFYSEQNSLANGLKEPYDLYINDSHSNSTKEVLHESSEVVTDSNKLIDKIDESPSKRNVLNESDVEKLKDCQNIKKSIKSINRSQYEHIITSFSNQEKNKVEEKSTFSALRFFVELPVNSFFSFISRSNLLKKENSDSKVADEQALSEKTHDESTDSNQNNDLPKSVLEGLYQYVPYVFSTSSKQSEEDSKNSKQKEIKKLKAEKELLHQKININNRTKYLLEAISDSISLFNLIKHIDELKDHLLRFPDTRITAINENGIQEVINVYRSATDEDLRRSSRMILAMLGTVDPPKMKGIRVLTIDGGGSRGIAAIEICRKLVDLTGRPINEMFDYICGVSTGAILGFSLGVLKMSMDELSSKYRKVTSDIFNRNRILGTGNLVLSHAFYNTEEYRKIMKKIFGSQLLIETAGIEDVPKCSAVSTLVNHLPLKPFLWRNYSVVPGTRQTHWSGTCRATMWEAVCASSAAPGYFEEFKKGYNIHQDGGVLTNNPTGVALNECRLLWPHTPIQCVVSVGTGRYEPVVGPVGEEFSSLKDKLLKLVDSATNVTEIHKVMYDLLPPGSYFRFNPFLDEPLPLDEYRPEKMNLLIDNTRKYIDTNDYKFRACARVLTNKKI